MENRTHAIVAVTFLVVFAVGAVLVYYWLAHEKSEPLHYEIVTSQSIGGLADQATVKFKGIDVGHVNHVGFDPDDRTKVVIDFSVQPHTYVTHQTYAVVAKQGLTGGSALELKLGKGSDTALKTSADHPARIPLHKGLLASLKSDAQKDMKDVHAVLSSARKMLGKGNRKHISASLKQIDTLTAKLTAIESKVPPLLKSLQQSVDQSHALLKHANQLVREARKPVSKAGKLEDSLQATARSAQQLSRKLNHQTAPDFHTLSHNLDRTSRQLDELLRELKAKPQSVIFGPPKHPPGPGEPGFGKQHKEPSGHE